MGCDVKLPYNNLFIACNILVVRHFSSLKFVEKGLVAEMVEVMLSYINCHYSKNPKISNTKLFNKMTSANSAYPDQSL